jgi:DnaB-like helicase C terminal domain
MSVENLVISVLVEDGASVLRTLYANGVTIQDFPVYDEEFDWIEKRLARRKVLNRRVFRQRFPEFEWSLPKEPTKDLISELKEERAFEEVNTLIAGLSERLERDNAIDLATEAREQLSRITRMHAPMSDSILEDWREDVADMKRHMRLARAGAPVGIKTGFKHLDHHWGGFIQGQMICVLGRTGEGKSYKTAVFALAAKLQRANVGYFTPELSRHEVKCRIHTLASAKASIQEACGLERSFRNRALLFKRGFNIKSYERFCQYFDEELPGRIHLLTGQHRGQKMTIGYIEDRIVELGLDLVIIDPIYLVKPIRIYRDNPYATVGTIAEATEELAERHSVPIVITNQANRQGPQGDAPHKDKSFGSDLPAQLSDYVLGVKHLSDENRMIVRCTKSRFGQEFRYEIDFWPNTGLIRELTPIKGSYLTDDDPDEARELITHSGGDDNGND